MSSFAPPETVIQNLILSHSFILTLTYFSLLGGTVNDVDSANDSFTLTKISRIGIKSKICLKFTIIQTPFSTHHTLL